MGKLMYSPADDDHPVTVAFGLTFNAGKAVEVEEAVFAKLKTNPQFKVASGDIPFPQSSSPPRHVPESPAGEPKKFDGRSKEARRMKAAAEEEAKARAAEHKADLDEALAERRQEMN